jgi:hypothetical protein
VNLRAEKDGFASETRQAGWQPAGASTLEVFRLEAVEAPFPIEPGTYTVTVTNDIASARDLSAPCAGFPSDLVSRTYAATIAADAAHPRTFFLVSMNGMGFGLGVAGPDVGFTIDGPAIVEALPGFRYLWITGTAPTTERPSATGSVTTIPFAGSFEYCQLKSAMPIGLNCFTTPATDRIDYHQCWSAHDTMVFRKR